MTLDNLVDGLTGDNAPVRAAGTAPTSIPARSTLDWWGCRSELRQHGGNHSPSTRDPARRTKIIVLSPAAVAHRVSACWAGRAVGTYGSGDYGCSSFLPYFRHGLDKNAQMLSSGVSSASAHPVRMNPVWKARAAHRIDRLPAGCIDRIRGSKAADSCRSAQNRRLS